MAQNINTMKLNQRMPSQTSYINNNYNYSYNNRAYSNLNNINNASNNSYIQNSISIINNNIDYPNQNQKLPQRPNINNMNSTNNNTNNINNQNQINMINNNNQKVKCTCTKTGCKKKYCYCFSKGILCDGCECKNCENCIPRAFPAKIFPNLQKNENSLENEEYNNNEDHIQITKPQRVICNCTKSNCIKKYCECFKQGLNCNSLCRCLDCKNKIYIENMNDFTENKNINMTNTNYNLSSNLKNNNTNNNNSFLSNDLINNNNFYNYALHNNINNNIINNNIINNSSYIPETFGKSVDFSNPVNFQPEAFGIYIKKEKLKIDIRKLNLNEEIKEINHNIINKINFSEINETPKFSNKKRLRAKNENSTSVKTCPTTNSSNKIKKAVSVVNKNIKKKKLQLS